jgi:hypothetical protein
LAKFFSQAGLAERVRASSAKAPLYGAFDGFANEAYSTKHTRSTYDLLSGALPTSLERVFDREVDDQRPEDQRQDSTVCRNDVACIRLSGPADNGNMLIICKGEPSKASNAARPGVGIFIESLSRRSCFRIETLSGGAIDGRGSARRL